jgi:Domain of unknown function (DUF4209)
MAAVNAQRLADADRGERRVWDPATMMDLPAPDASDDLIEYLDQAGQSAENWREISAALLKRQQETSDIQAAWLVMAFDYCLGRELGDDRSKSTAFNSELYPTPLAQLPAEVVALWASTADRVTAAAPRARLHHLLFERGHGNKGTHGREAAAAYLTLGTGPWSRLERVNCLDWAVDLRKRIGDTAAAAEVYPELVTLAIDSLDQEEQEPGVALQALEVLAFEDSGNSHLPDLLERARHQYTNPYLTAKTIGLQERVFKADSAKREQLRRETVQAFFDHALSHPPGLVRMAFLEDTAKAANQYGFVDLSEKATAAMQEMSSDDLGLRERSATLTLPAGTIDALVAGLVERQSLADVFQALAGAEPPTGDVDTNMQSRQQLAAQTISSIFPTKNIGQDGLPSYTATSEDDRIDQQLARIESIGLGIGGEVTARVLEGALARFPPSEAELITTLQALPHVSHPIARSVARAILAFQAKRYEEATTVAMARIEALVRTLCEEKGVLRFRVQRDKRQGPSTRGQYPQLGALLVEIEQWMDRSWHRFLWTFLVSPFGPNYRNELLHGYVDDATRIPAALTILAALRLALIPLSADRAGPPETASIVKDR